MSFATTYDEYLWLRQQHGYEPELAMVRAVWERCDPDAQENMLEQFWAPLRATQLAWERAPSAYGTW